MLVSDIPALREYWYPVAYSADVSAHPRGFRIFGSDYVLWRPFAAEPVRAALDECPHRAASLSQGWVEQGCITCPYHGWRFNSEGACVRIPTADDDLPIPRTARLETVMAAERYGLVWVCTGVPRTEVPFLAEADDPEFTVIHEMMERWSASAPRVMDNALDASHVSWIHRGTIGDPATPRLEGLTVTSQGLSLRYTTNTVIRVNQQLKANTGITTATTVRKVTVEMVNPLVYRAVLEYVDNGLIHVLLKAMTPVDDQTTLFCQFVARNDSPDDDKQQGIASLDRAVQAEDRAILERIKPDFPVDVTAEVHTRSDRMTIEYRRVLAALAAESQLAPSP